MIPKFDTRMMKVNLISYKRNQDSLASLREISRSLSSDFNQYKKPKGLTFKVSISLGDGEIWQEPDATGYYLIPMYLDIAIKLSPNTVFIPGFKDIEELVDTIRDEYEGVSGFHIEKVPEKNPFEISGFFLDSEELDDNEEAKEKSIAYYYELIQD